MNALDIKQMASFRAFARGVHSAPLPVLDTLSDEELQAYLEAKLATHRAQRGVVL